MRKHFLVNLIFISAFIQAKAQTEVILIHGKILNSVDSTAVPFAELGISGTTVFCTADLRGNFILKIPKQMQQDSLLAFASGFDVYKVSVKAFSEKDTIRIFLFSKIIALPDVTIGGESAKAIVAKAIKRIPQNFDLDSSEYSCFYRQFHKENGKYVRLIEASVNVQFQNKNEKVETNYLRRSDNLEQNAEQHGDHLIDLLESNPVLHSLGTVLNEKGLEYYKFSFDTTSKEKMKEGMLRMKWDTSATAKISVSVDSSEENKILYAIKFISKPSADDKIETGEIWIDQSTYSITKIIVEKYSNPRARNHRTNTTVPYDWQFVHDSSCYTFFPFLFRMIPDHFFKTYQHYLFNNRTGTLDYVVDETFDLDLNRTFGLVSTDGKPVKRNFRPTSNLYSQHYFYLPGNFEHDLKYNPLPPEIKHDLEKDRSLEEQFEVNGGR